MTNICQNQDDQSNWFEFIHDLSDNSLGSLDHFESMEVKSLTQGEFSQRFTLVTAVTCIDCLLPACFLSRFRAD